MILQVLHSLTVAFDTSRRGSAISAFVILNTAHEAGHVRVDGQFLLGKWACDAVARFAECALPGFARVRVFRKKCPVVREHAGSVFAGEIRDGFVSGMG